MYPVAPASKRAQFPVRRIREEKDSVKASDTSQTCQSINLNLDGLQWRVRFAMCRHWFPLINSWSTPPFDNGIRSQATTRPFCYFSPTRSQSIVLRMLKIASLRRSSKKNRLLSEARWKNRCNHALLQKAQKSKRKSFLLSLLSPKRFTICTLAQEREENFDQSPRFSSTRFSGAIHDCLKPSGGR